MTDPTPAAGGLSEAETEFVYDWTPDDPAQRQRMADDLTPLLAARTEAVARELARVTAAVEAWIDEAPEQTAGLDLLRQIIQPARTEAADRELARVTALCSQCGERPSAMVKIGTTDGWCVECLDQAADSRVTAAVEALADECASSGCVHLNEMWGKLRAALSSADTGALDRERAKAAGEAWDEAAELADSVIVSWAAVPGLHPEAQEPHPAAIAAAGARRTLVVLRSRMTEAFIDRAAAASPEQPRPDVAGGDEPPLPVRGDGNTGRGAAAVSPEGGDA